VHGSILKSINIHCIHETHWLNIEIHVKIEVEFQYPHKICAKLKTTIEVLKTTLKLNKIHAEYLNGFALISTWINISVVDFDI